MRRERDTIILCWLLLHRHLSTQTTHGARSAQSRLASPSSGSKPSSSEAGTQLTAFSQISAHASGAWHHPNTLVSIPIWDFYFDICEWHILSAHAWTPELMLHLTNPCTKRKVLILTKPKGKIYKTKSLRHYITLRWVTIPSKFGSHLAPHLSGLVSNKPKVSKLVSALLYFILTNCPFCRHRYDIYCRILAIKFSFSVHGDWFQTSGNNIMACLCFLHFYIVS